MNQLGIEIHGQVEAGFEKVRDAFAANFDKNGDVGAAVCLYRDGHPVVADVQSRSSTNRRTSPRRA